MKPIARQISRSSLLLSPRDASMSVTRRVPTKAGWVPPKSVQTDYLQAASAGRTHVIAKLAELDAERHERRRDVRCLPAICVASSVYLCVSLSPCHLCVLLPRTLP